jgi:hypothetical protein
MSEVLKGLVVLAAADGMIISIVVLGLACTLNQRTARKRFKDRRQCKKIMREANDFLYGEADSFLEEMECSDYATETARLLAAIRLAMAYRVRPLTGDQILARVERLVKEKVDVCLMIGALDYCVRHQLLLRVARGVGWQYKFRHVEEDASEYVQTNLSFQELKTL